MKKLLLAAAVALAASPSLAAIKTQTVEYRQGDALLEGYLAYDDSTTGKRPGVLVVHEWWGLNDYIRMRAEKLAGLGYVAFAADIYGKGKRTQDPQEAGKLAGAFRSDPALLRARALAGLEVLRANDRVDTGRVAAIGFCFGGTTVLELARANAGLQGVVSFHGGLKAGNPESAQAIKPKVLVLHGADDPFVSKDEVATFQDEMRRAKADWQMIYYGGAVHSFTNPAADGSFNKGALYNEAADRRSWEDMKVFFAELFR